MSDGFPQNADSFDTSGAAQYLGGLSPRTLEVWRSTKRYALAYFKVGRCVRYRKSDLDDFLAARRVSCE
jgi:hypothetical protein